MLTFMGISIFHLEFFVLFVLLQLDICTLKLGVCGKGFFCVGLVSAECIEKRFSVRL
jgi:hypothetical protein